MKLGMMVEVTMLAAARGFGALAIRHWRAQGTQHASRRANVPDERGKHA